MKYTKKIVAAVLCGCMVIAGAGCSKEEDFDAQGYVQGVLDAQYHENYTRHAKDTGSTEEELQEQMETQLFDTAKAEIDSSGLIATDEEINQYVDIIESGYDKVQYTVGEAVKDSDANYTVDVEVTPVGFLDNLQTVFTEKLQAAVNEGATEEQYMAVFIESVQYCVDNAPTYDPQTVTLHVVWTEEGADHVYYVEEADLTTLENTAAHLN